MIGQVAGAPGIGGKNLLLHDVSSVSKTQCIAAGSRKYCHWMTFSITARNGKNLASCHVYTTVKTKAFTEHIEHLTPFEIYCDWLTRWASTLCCS